MSSRDTDIAERQSDEDERAWIIEHMKTTVRCDVEPARWVVQEVVVTWMTAPKRVKPYSEAATA